MATALQQQLAVIAANSTHQLDLKAQKARHSKSLLFEPRDAAAQSFDTIYQICYEGFEELCALDSRFATFSRNIFSEQSKNEDRTQMTAKENGDLDQILETFLGLVGGRLLLKPAMKAVEWLVRRFRVQEYNMECVLLTFLPYHTSHIFPTLLSILPDQLLPSFKFLQPYKASLQSPPRTAILSAAVGNLNFFSALNNYVLKFAKARHHSAILLGFWASITAQAVNGMVDTSRSGRDSIRQQREEDLLLRVLPVLQSALSIKGIPELYLGACMVITILATKASLEDKALDAMMEAVAGSWSQETIREGIMCLAVIAEEKEQISFPATVTRAVLQADGGLGQLVSLAKSQRVSKLAAGVAAACVHLGYKKKNNSLLTKVQELLDADILPDRHVVFVLEKLITTLVRSKKTAASSEIGTAISTVLMAFADDSQDQSMLERAAQDANTSLTALQLLPYESQDADAMDPDLPTVAAAEARSNEADEKARFEVRLQSLPALPKDFASFLDINFDAHIFQLYADAFQGSLSSSTKKEHFLALPQLRRSESHAHTGFLSFLARVSSSNATAAAKVAALSLMREQVTRLRAQVDLQQLFPHVLLALSDASTTVRRVAAELCRALCTYYDDYQPRGKQGKIPIANICGPTVLLKHGLSNSDAHRFVRCVVLPAVEDSVLDKDYIIRYLTDIINEKRDIDTKGFDATPTTSKKFFRADLCSFLASHLILPVMRIRFLLLQILKEVGKAAAQARSQIVLPFVREYLKAAPDDILPRLKTELISTSDMDRAVLGNLTHRSMEEVDLLEVVAAAKVGKREELVPLAFERISQLYPIAKGSQLQIADWMLDLSLAAPESGSATSKPEALQTLRSLSLSTEVLVHLVESLPKAADIQEHPPTKKRRMSGSASTQTQGIDHVKVQAVILHITLVLEIVESSNPETHPQLLRGLFHTLSELHHFKTLLNSDLVYTFQSLLGCILAVVDGLRTNPSADVDRTVIRTDLIVECVRTTSSTQIHNTALLLVSSLASWAPELVLHCVMPLFTFMSSSLLRQSDSFSAHVTDQTVERIVPPLAASLKKKGKVLVVGASELLLSFTAAFEHIPLHRRAGLFKHLVETLGAEETLFAVIAMLVERYGGESNVMSFVANLANQFSALVTIRAAKQYLDLVSDALKPKRNLADVLLSFGEKDVTETVESQETLLEGLAILLRNITLRERLVADLTQNTDDSRAIRTTFASMLEHTMQVNRDLATNASLKSPADALLLSVLGLMPTKDFIESSAQLMQTGTDQTRQQVFRALEARVSGAKASDTTTRQIFLNVLPNCGVFLREDQPVATRHAAISCIDQICERYGKTDRSAVLAVAKQVAGEYALGSDDLSLQIISILCLASMVEVLGDECIPILPNVLTRVLAYLHDDSERWSTVDSREPSTELQAAGFALLNAILDHLPWMLADRDLDKAFLVVEAAAVIAPPINGLEEFGKLVAKKIGAPQLFASIQRTSKSLSIEGTYDKAVMRYHLNVLHTAVQSHDKATIIKNARVIFSILYEAFDLRRSLYSQPEYEDQWHELFDLVDRIALDVTLKLNDATFRPFFLTLVEWATNPSAETNTSDAMTLRLISLYSFSLTLFEQLQSIVTSYASFLLENASFVLKERPMGTPWDEKRLNLVLRTLSSSFNHDQDEFWQTPAHFEAVAAPLIDQVQRQKASQLTGQVIATITDLAAAARSQEHLKTINAAIIAQLRSGDAAVRLAAVKCQRSLTERLAVDWLDLLPEMLPIISELHEDDNEDVERETLRWAKEIEEITGESLDRMLA